MFGTGRARTLSDGMRIATFNVNGVNGRLPLLLDWLAEAAARRGLPAGIEGAAGQVPGTRRSRRPATARSGTASSAGTESPSSPAAASRSRPAAACPAIPRTSQSRYIEAAVGGVLIGGLYAPNGNPQPGPKFDYKLAWNERLIARAARAGRR